MYLKTLMFILFVCVCDVQRGRGHPCITVHVWMSEDKLDVNPPRIIHTLPHQHSLMVFVCFASLFILVYICLFMGIGFIFLPCGSSVSNSSCQAYKQTPLPVEIS